MSEQRICKECGKPFTPKGREKYCSNTHYRPCPICGELVLVTYLSDPARRCEKCKNIRGSKPKMVPKQIVAIIPKKDDILKEVVTVNKIDNTVADIRKAVSIPETIDQHTFCSETSNTVMLYIGNNHKNSFITGHEYLITVDRDDYTYRVTSTQDVTTGDECDIVINYASQISFYQNFAKVS